MKCSNQLESPPEKGLPGSSLSVRPLPPLSIHQGPPPQMGPLTTEGAGPLTGGSLVGQMTSLARSKGPQGGRQPPSEEHLGAGNLQEGVEMEGEGRTRT